MTHRTTHALARFFLEIDANFKQFRTARRLSAAARQRLEAQLPFYEESRIPIDRYLDAVSQHAADVARAAQFRTIYNISIIALEQAKGTLLEYDRITIATTPRTAPHRRTLSGFLAQHGESVMATAPGGPAPPQPIGPTPVESQPGAHAGNKSTTTPQVADAPNAGQTFSFHWTIGTSPQPIEVRGSFTIRPVPDRRD